MRSRDGIPQRRFCVYGLMFVLMAMAHLNIAQAEEAAPQYITGTADAPEDETFKAKQFDEKTFQIAYKVFLMNGNAAKAYAVSKLAVELNPKSHVWRKNLAQAAMWSGHLDVALAQYRYFFFKRIQREAYAEKIVPLAGQVRDFSLQLAVLEEVLTQHPQDDNVQQQYVDALLGAGFPEKALNYLNQYAKTRQKVAFIQQYVMIAQSTNNLPLLGTALQQWKQIAPHDPKPWALEAQMEMDLGHIPTAINAYMHVIHLEPKPSQEAFEKLIALVSLTDNRSNLLFAYKNILKSPTPPTWALTNLVTLEAASGHDEQAYHDAMEGYRKTPSYALFELLMQLGAAREAWPQVLSLYQHAKAKTIQRFERKKDNLVLLATLYARLKQTDKANRIWSRLLTAHPESLALKANFLWYLIDTGQYTTLKRMLFLWQQQGQNNEEFWKAYAASLSLLGEHRAALTLSFRHLNVIFQHVSAVLNLADLLQNTHQSKLANDMKWRALVTWLNAPPTLAKLNATLPLQLTLARLAHFFSGAEVRYRVMQTLQAHLFKQAEVNDMLLSYALDQDANALARMLVRTLQNAGLPPASWMQLNLALKENDLPAMAALLHHETLPLTANDKVEAALRLGYFKKAEQAAYEGLAKEPYNASTYALFEEALLARANVVSSDTSYYVFSPLAGIKNETHLRSFIMPEWALTPYNQIWFLHTQDALLIAHPPSNLRTTGIRLKRLTRRGDAEVKLGSIQGLKGDAVAGLYMHYRFRRDLEGLLNLDYHDLAIETAPLLIGGMKNSVNAVLNYQWDTHLAFSTEASHWQYYGQNRQHLGYGSGLTFSGFYQFFFTDPDWNIAGYWTLRDFVDNNVLLDAPLQRIVPQGTPPTSVFYMPVSFREFGVTLGFGQKYREQYNHHWRAFVDTGLTFSNAFGLGKVLSIGATGSVFGRDKLLFYFNYADNTQQAAQNVYSAGARYSYYF